VAIRAKVFSTKFGDVASYGGTSEQNVSFLLRKFPAICYIYGGHLFTVFYSLCTSSYKSTCISHKYATIDNNMGHNKGCGWE